MQQNAEYKDTLYCLYIFDFFIFFFFFYVFFLFFFLDIYNISLLSEYQPGTTVSRPSRTPRTPRTPGLSDSRTSWLFGPDCFLVLQTRTQPINASAQTQTTRPKLLQPGPHLNISAQTFDQPVPHLSSSPIHS